MESSGFQMTPLILLTAAHTAFFLGRLPSMSAAFLRSYLMTLECPQFQLPFIQCPLRVSATHCLASLTSWNPGATLHDPLTLALSCLQNQDRVGGVPGSTGSSRCSSAP